MSHPLTPHNDTSLGGEGKDFPRTTGSFLENLASGPDGDRRPAFEILCRRYWKPVYYFIRIGRAASNEEAKDLTQSFFAWFFESDALGRYERERGSFRTFLRTLLRGFLADRHRAEHRVKRGGGVDFLTLDAKDLEVEDPRAADPDAAFDRLWLVSFMKHCVEAVRAELEGGGRSGHVRVFEEIDLRDGPKPTYAEVAARLGLSESQVRDMLAVARELLRREMRAELARQTRDSAELEEEWRALLGI